MSELSAATPLVALVYAFGMGLLSSCTPCVYPMIPITLSILGANANARRSQAFLRSLTYVSGIALTYTLLGMLSAKTGMMFGSLLSDPRVIVAISFLLITLTLHSLDIINLPFAGLQNRASKVGGKGYLGALLMGIVSGAVGAPCVGPVLVLLLVEAARSPSVGWGSLLLFCYALGLGIPFLLLGTFSGLVRKVPRAGGWLYGVKFVIALGLLVTTVFFLNTLDLSLLNLLQTSVPTMIWALVAIGGGYWAAMAVRSKFKLQQFASAAVLALCIYSIGFNSKDAAATLPGARLEWSNNYNKALQYGRENGKIIMVDLYSKWCLACKELDHSFSDSRVAERASRDFVPVRVDFTKKSALTEEIAKKYEVLGLPCVLFLTPDGKEVIDSRLTGVIDPEELVEHLSRVGTAEARRAQNNNGGRL